jgi:hypothetical protein
MQTTTCKISVTLYCDSTLLHFCVEENEVCLYFLVLPTDRVKGSRNYVTEHNRYCIL